MAKGTVVGVAFSLDPPARRLASMRISFGYLRQLTAALQCQILFAGHNFQKILGAAECPWIQIVDNGMRSPVGGSGKLPASQQPLKLRSNGQPEKVVRNNTPDDVVPSTVFLAQRAPGGPGRCSTASRTVA